MNEKSKKMRKLILDAAFFAKHGHVPSALSVVEIIVAIYELKNKEDVFVLSKGHGCLAFYSHLVLSGIISEEELRSFGKKSNKLGGHPDRNKLNEIYASTGSLGHGLPICVGSALARKIQNKTGTIFCVIGDGESNEGSIWEACMVAAKNKLNNLVCIVDNNNSQIRSLPTTDLVDKFKAFGWCTSQAAGHSVNELINELSQRHDSKPRAIIANTVKGFGIKDIEKDMFAWHHRAPSPEEYHKFLREIDAS
tara:strand:+ start:144 stop:896 length:753 start_codon:yes stop_codon:yes gene_type:complete